MGEEELIPILINTNHPDILLRQLTPENAEPLFKLIDRDRSHLSQFGDNTSSKYPTVKSVLMSITNNLNPDKLRFGIWYKGVLIGTANLTPEHPLFGGSGVLGYWIGSAYTGRGIATVTAKALAAYARERLNWSLLVGWNQTDS